MAINTSGVWWVGTEPQDIQGFLDAYTKEGQPSDEFRLAKCSCGSIDFNLAADDEEGAAKRICVRCEEEHFICDSEEYWDEAEPDDWECVECGSKETNIGVGFSMSDDKTAIRWLYVGVRCPKCGVLGCFAGWKIDYDPSLHLLNKV